MAEKGTEQNKADSEAESKPENKPENKADTKVSKLPARKPIETRWVKNAFFEGGMTKNIRLDELHNELNQDYAGQGDMTDEQLAAEILSRAGLKEHPRYLEMLEGFTEFFSTIPDPAMKWVNPNYGNRFPRHIEPK